MRFNISVRLSTCLAIAVIFALVANFSIVAARPLQQAGIEIVFQAQPLSGNDKVNPDQLDQTQAVVENRINDLGLSQHLVRTQGNDRIVVQMAEVVNADPITATLGAVGLLELIDAGNDALNPGIMVQTSSAVAPAVVPGAAPSSAPTATPGSKVYPVIITGADIDPTGVMVEFDQVGAAEVAFRLRSNGAKKLADFTASHVGKYMPIVLDKKVISSPVIQATIPNGEGVISNLSGVDEAKKLAAILKYGSLPVRLTLVESRAVADLGLPTPTPLVATSLSPTTPTAPASSSQQGGLAPGVIIRIIAVVVILLALIAFLILRRLRR